MFAKHDFSMGVQIKSTSRKENPNIKSMMGEGERVRNMYTNDIGDPWRR